MVVAAACDPEPTAPAYWYVRIGNQLVPSRVASNSSVPDHVPVTCTSTVARPPHDIVTLWLVAVIEPDVCGSTAIVLP